MVKFKYLSKNKINSLPKTIGVYAFKQGKEFLYIGKAVSIKQRVKNHFKQPVFKDDIFILPKTDKIGYIKTDSEIEALLLEAELIKKHQPKYNVVWKDDKNYFWVAITKEEFPRIFITHQLQTTNYKLPTKYIGPFIDNKALKQTLRVLRRVFPYRTCNKMPKKPCLFFDLKLCAAPCAAKVTKKEYQRNIKNLMEILQGKRQVVLRKLKKEMQIASQNQNFEKAADLRDKIFALENVFEHARIIKEMPQTELFWPATEKKLKALLATKGRIKRIEGYDISNIQGKEATGGLAVFTQGLPDKKEYKKFKVRIAGKPDDIAMLKEVLNRRFQHPEWPLPQVMLIDGGKAQLNVALKVKSQISNLKNTNQKSKIKNIKVISLAKRENKLFVEGKQKPVLLKNLPQDISNLVLQIRDEAHRFAISYHKKLRRKTFIHNSYP